MIGKFEVVKCRGRKYVSRPRLRELWPDVLTSGSQNNYKRSQKVSTAGFNEKRNVFLSSLKFTKYLRYFFISVLTCLFRYPFSPNDWLQIKHMNVFLHELFWHFDLNVQIIHLIFSSFKYHFDLICGFKADWRIVGTKSTNNFRPTGKLTLNSMSFIL